MFDEPGSREPKILLSLGSTQTQIYIVSPEPGHARVAAHSHSDRVTSLTLFSFLMVTAGARSTGPVLTAAVVVAGVELQRTRVALATTVGASFLAPTFTAATTLIGGRAPPHPSCACGGSRGKAPTPATVVAVAGGCAALAAVTAAAAAVVRPLCCRRPELPHAHDGVLATPTMIPHSRYRTSVVDERSQHPCRPQ
jgi:hypothetical protein